MNDRWGLKTYEINAVVDFFLHYMPLDQRRQLATELPVVYAKLCGGKVEMEPKQESDEGQSRR